MASWRIDLKIRLEHVSAKAMNTGPFRLSPAAIMAWAVPRAAPGRRSSRGRQAIRHLHEVLLHFFPECGVDHENHFLHGLIRRGNDILHNSLDHRLSSYRMSGFGVVRVCGRMRLPMPAIGMMMFINNE
jgi:hypothetical protein